MLEALLRQLAAGHTHTLASLADALQVSAHLVEQMLADLARGGYIKEVELSAGTACEGHCEGCPSGSLCAVMHGQRIWALTDKGVRAAR